LTATVRSASTDDQTAADLLRASVDAPRSVSYVGRQESVRFSSSRANATIVRVEHRAPDLTRRWYLAPEALYGDYIITRGGDSYEFDTKRSRVTTSHAPVAENQVTLSDAIGLVSSNYRAVLGDREIIAGRATTSIALVSKYTGERAERVWIDDRTHLALKKEVYHGNGSIASQTRFEEVRYTDQIPEDIFTTSAPSGYAQIAAPDLAPQSSDVDRLMKTAGFAPQVPRYLPQGFGLTGGDVADVNGVRTLHLVYSDGLRAISLFENAKGAAADFGALHPHDLQFENHDAQYVEDGPTTLLTWKERGLYFALVGDLLRDELVDIAKSVVP
jgi:negative regulator of sigma E activity